MEQLLFHPKVVHLPIALAVLMPLVSAGLVLAWWREWLPRRAWILAAALQGVLLVSGIVSLRTGEADEERVEAVVPEAALEAHEEAATIFVAASGIVLALALAAALVPKPQVGLGLAAATALGAVVVLGLGYQVGEAGGRLVYEHGAASVHVGGGTAPPGELAGAGEDHDDDDD